jgi:hypothetical protein
MALFTDGPINGTTDIQDHENAVLNVTTTENIDLDAKIRLAQDEIANDVMLFLLRRQPLLDAQAATRRRMGLADVAVTAPLRQWHALKTLSLVYRDAYNNQLNDRYRGKWTEYEQLGKVSAQTYYQIGVGLVARPISKASDAVLTVTSGSASGGVFYVAVAWSNDDGQEGAASEVGQLATLDGQRLSVTSVGPPDNASGWNVYVGDQPDLLTLQNSDPIAVGSIWIMDSPLFIGKPLGAGQLPTCYVVDQNVMERG